jgi:anti-anti-sigma factor
MTQLATLDLDSTAGATLATLTGEVDMSNAEGLEGRLVAAVPNTARGLVLDVRGLRYLDSAGVRVLFALDERLTNRGQRLVIVVEEGSNVERVLDLTGIRPAIPIARDVDAALDRVAG